jgi:hypothetical protein
MFLGILQAALSKNLNGIHGLAVSKSLHLWHYPSKVSVANSRCDRDGNGPLSLGKFTSAMQNVKKTSVTEIMTFLEWLNYNSLGLHWLFHYR